MNKKEKPDGKQPVRTHLELVCHTHRYRYCIASEVGMTLALPLTLAFRHAWLAIEVLHYEYTCTLVGHKPAELETMVCCANSWDRPVCPYETGGKWQIARPDCVRSVPVVTNNQISLAVFMPPHYVLRKLLVRTPARCCRDVSRKVANDDFKGRCDSRMNVFSFRKATYQKKERAEEKKKTGEETRGAKEIFQREDICCPSQEKQKSWSG